MMNELIWEKFKNEKVGGGGGILGRWNGILTFLKQERAWVIPAVERRPSSCKWKGEEKAEPDEA